MMGGFISLLIALVVVFFLYQKLRGDYFVKVDENGISWRQSIVSRFIFIPWNYMMRVDYLVYEINFQIKESRQVVSFATSGLEDEQTDALKQYISDTVKRIKESPQ
jgi:predicted P-loop ATPase/GTPase